MRTFLKLVNYLVIGLLFSSALYIYMSGAEKRAARLNGMGVDADEVAVANASTVVAWANGANGNNNGPNVNNGPNANFNNGANTNNAPGAAADNNAPGAMAEQAMQPGAQNNDLNNPNNPQPGVGRQANARLGVQPPGWDVNQPGFNQPNLTQPAANQPVRTPSGQAGQPGQVGQVGQPGQVVQGGVARPGGNVAVNLKALAAQSGVLAPYNKILHEGHWIGLEVVALTPALAAANNISPDVKGVLVDEVTLLAAASGIMAGDVIVSINGVKTPDLVLFQTSTKGVANSREAAVSIIRGGAPVTVEVEGPDVLGMAQMEAAQMILATAVSPHAYYGPCDKCHTIAKTPVNTGQLAKDAGDVLTVVAPPIKWGATPPHRDRGRCTNCHKIL
jgi:hypothetical protein